jgi:hypothetical protein
MIKSRIRQAEQIAGIEKLRMHTQFKQNPEGKEINWDTQV